MIRKHPRAGIAGKLIVGAAALLLLAVMALAAGIYFFTQKDELLRKGAEKGTAYVLDVPATVGGASLELQNEAVQLNDIVIPNPQGFESDHAMAFATIRAEVDVQSLRTEVPTIRLIRISGADIILEQKKGGSNLQKLMENAQRLSDPNKPVDPNEEPARFRVQKIVVEGSTTRVAIPFLGGKTYDVPIEDIEITDLGGEDGILTAEEMAEVLIETVAGQIGMESQGLLPTDALSAMQGSLTDMKSSAQSTLDQAKESIGGVKDAAKDVKDSIGGLFGKKSAEDSNTE
ncbi:MAG: AsmA family protein [Sumerlaeia bacterium]